MMKRQIAAILVAFLCLHTPLSASAGVIEVSPGNMVFLDVTDKNGNSIPNVKVTMYNSAGAEIGGIYNDEYFFESNDSGIDGTELNERYNYDLPWSMFTPYAAPQALHSINICRTNWGDDDYVRYANRPVYITTGVSYKLQLYCYDAAQAAALTVPANQFAVYVDPKWANREAVGYVTTPTLTYYFNRKNTSSVLDSLNNIPVGKVSMFGAFNPDYDAYIGLEYKNGGGSVSSNSIEVSNTATQYVLCRLPLQQLCPYFEQDGNYERDGLLYDLRKDTALTSAILTIQSGAVINAVIPDKNGYVEFYLDRATREYSLDYCFNYQNIPTDSGNFMYGGSGFCDWGVAANIVEHYLETATIPNDEIVLTQVPAGTYTLAYSSIPQGYAAPKTTTITVTNSKEMQHVRLVLEDVPLLGDVNSDKQINAADAAALLKAASAIGSGGASGLTDAQKTAADVNADGTFNAVDAALILQYAAYLGTGGTQTIEEFLNRV